MPIDKETQKLVDGIRRDLKAGMLLEDVARRLRRRRRRTYGLVYVGCHPTPSKRAGRQRGRGQEIQCRYGQSLLGAVRTHDRGRGGSWDLAYSVGTYRVTLTPRKAGAKPLPTDEGKFLEVLKKQADGSWKIVYDMWSSNAPAARQ